MAGINNKNNYPVAVNYLPHPLTSQGAENLAVEAGTTITQLLKKINYPVKDADQIVVWVNGKQVNDFKSFYVYDGDVVNIRPVVNGDNIGQILATIAIIVISIYFPPALAAAGIGTVGAAVITAGAVYAATKLIYSAFPPPEPQEIDRKESYLLSGTRNRKRLFEGLPLIVGELRVAPDSASSAFGRFKDDDQLVYQVFHFGLQPRIKLSDFRIGDTPFNSYVVPPKVFYPDTTGALPFQFNDTEVLQGLAVTKKGGPYIATVKPGSIALELDVQITAYDTDKKGRINSRTVSFRFEIIDVKSSQVVHTKEYTISGDKINEVKKTITVKLPKSQYRAEVTKISEDKTSSKGQRQFTVVALKSTQEDLTNYSDQYRLGLEVLAGNQLSGVINEFTAVAYEEIPVYKSGSWHIEKTTNPAWWLLWWIRGRRNIAGQLLFGGGLNDAQIDIDAIIRFGQWCDRKKLTISLWLNKNSTVKRVANIIARCGRGEITWGTGKFGVIWDDDQAVPVAVFGPSNIRANSFKVQYDAQKTADEVIVNFLNKDNDYKPDSVRVPVGNIQNPERPIQFQFEGCTDADMAGREARLIAAAQQLMRRSVVWETDIEGVIAKRGDVVRLSHDMIGWSQSGRIISSADRQTFFIDKDINLTAKGFIGIRSPNGQYETFKIRSVNGKEVVLSSEPPAKFKMPGEIKNLPSIDWMWFYDEGGKPGKEVKITDVQVKNRDTLAFTAKDYLPEYYRAETGDYIHVSPSAPGKPFNGLITGVIAWETYRVSLETKTLVLALSWIPVSSVNQYTIRIWSDEVGGEQQVITSNSGARFDVTPGRYNYRISGPDALTGEIYSAVGSMTISGATVLAPVKSLRATTILGGIILDWKYPDNPLNLRRIKITATYTDDQSRQEVIENFTIPYPTNTFTHSGLSVAQRVNYSVVLVDAEGNSSPAVDVSGISSDNIQQIIDAIDGELDESALSQDLKQRIDKIEVINNDLSNLETSVDSDFKKVRNDLATAEQDLDAEIKKTNAAVNGVKQDLTATNNAIAAAKQEAQAGINEVTAKVGDVNSKLTMSVGSVKADVDEVSKELQNAVRKEAQNNEDLKTELKQLIAVSGVKTFSQQAEPTGAHEGDIWFKENAQGDVIETYRFNGGNWEISTHQNIQSNAAAIIREQNARASADSALSTQISRISATVSDNTTAINRQVSTLAKADLALGKRIDEIVTKSNGNETKIQQETSARTTADSALGARIDSINTKVGTASAAINNESTARAKADQALSTTLSALTSTVGKNTTSINTEKTARSNADTALGRRIDSLVTKSNGNDAAIKSEATARAAADGALGSRIDSVTATANKKADKSAVNALARRVTTAESNINGKASASEVNTLKSSVETLFNNEESQLTNNLAYNGRFKIKDKDGRPAGWYAAYSNSDPVTIGIDGTGAYLSSRDDSTIGVSSTAFAVNPGSQYKIRYRVKSQTAKSSGFYSAIYEYDGDLPANKKAISNQTGESAVQEDTRLKFLTSNKSIPASWKDEEHTYTPTASAKFASFGFLNWTGMGSNNKLYFELVDITEIPAKAYVDAEIKTVNSTIATRDAAMAKRVTDLTATLKTDATNKANAVNNSLTTKINQVESALTTKESALAKRITDLTTSVSNKANNSTVGAINTRLRTAESALIGKASASEVSTLKSTVTTVKETADTIKRTGLAYTQDIVVEGDADKYYPVYIKGGDQNRMRRIVVRRHYSEQAPATWNTPTHKGGLTLDINANFGNWGGAQYAWWLNECNQVYSAMFAGAGNRVHFQWFVIFLRGGGAVYHVDSDQSLNLQIAYGGNSELIYDSPTNKPSEDVYADEPLDNAWTTEQIAAKEKGSKNYAGLGNVDNLSADQIREPVETKLTAAIQTVNNTITTKESALAKSVTDVQASVNSKTAAIQQTLTATATKVGGLESKYSVKIDNNGLISGFGLLSTANDGAATSEFGIRADTFYIGAPAGANVDKKNNKYPFIVKNGVVYMRSALIENAAITSAKIANTIQSTNYQPGRTGWRLNKAGPSEFNADVKVNATIRADRIDGDVASAMVLAAAPKTGANWATFDSVSVKGKSSRPRRLVCTVSLKASASRSGSSTGWAYASAQARLTGTFGTTYSQVVETVRDYRSSGNGRTVSVTGQTEVTLIASVPANQTGRMSIQVNLVGGQGSRSATISGTSGDYWLAQLLPNGSDLGS